MLKSMDTETYRESWAKAERKAIIAKFHTSKPWGWESTPIIESDNDVGVTVPEPLLPANGEASNEFDRDDFMKALKKAARPLKKA